MTATLTTTPEPSPQADAIAALTKQRVTLLLTWAVLYQELGVSHALVVAQQSALDVVTRQLRLLKQEHEASEPDGDVAARDREGGAHAPR